MNAYIKEIKEEFKKNMEYVDKELMTAYPNADRDSIKYAIITKIANDYAITPYQVKKMVEQ